jgi:hypothetical protein
MHEMTRLKPNRAFHIHSYRPHEAAKAGNIPELEHLFSSGEENPLRLDYSRKTPLHYAVNFGKQLLLEKQIVSLHLYTETYKELFTFFWSLKEILR